MRILLGSARPAGQPIQFPKLHRRYTSLGGPALTQTLPPLAGDVPGHGQIAIPLPFQPCGLNTAGSWCGIKATTMRLTHESQLAVSDKHAKARAANIHGPGTDRFRPLAQHVCVQVRGPVVAEKQVTQRPIRALVLRGAPVLSIAADIEPHSKVALLIRAQDGFRDRRGCWFRPMVEFERNVQGVHLGNNIAQDDTLVITRARRVPVGIAGRPVFAPQTPSHIQKLLYYMRVSSCALLIEAVERLESSKHDY